MSLVVAAVYKPKPFLLFCRSGGIQPGIFPIRDKYKGSLCGIPATVSNNINGLDDCNYGGCNFSWHSDSGCAYYI